MCTQVHYQCTLECTSSHLAFLYTTHYKSSQAWSGCGPAGSGFPLTNPRVKDQEISGITHNTFRLTRSVWGEPVCCCNSLAVGLWVCDGGLTRPVWLCKVYNKPACKKATVTLVSADGTPLTIHGCACVELELEGNTFMTDIVVVSPLTAEAILGLGFLQEQQASIDLANKTLHLKEKGCDIPLRDPTPSHQSSAVQLVRAVRTVEVPPRSSLEISASTNVAVEGVWLLEEEVFTVCRGSCPRGANLDYHPSVHPELL